MTPSVVCNIYRHKPEGVLTVHCIHVQYKFCGFYHNDPYQIII